MYGYYALRASRVPLPRFFQISITILQLIQMLIGCFVNVAAYIQKQTDPACEASVINIQLSLAMYASYFVLFTHFFYKTYLSKESKQKLKKQN